MKQILIDAWGRPSYNPNYKNAANTPAAYQIAASGNITYIRYSDSPKNAIRKITDNSGITTIEVAFGSWENRATLEYQPVNKPLLINADELENIWARV